MNTPVSTAISAARAALLVMAALAAADEDGIGGGRRVGGAGVALDDDEGTGGGDTTGGRGGAGVTSAPGEGVRAMLEPADADDDAVDELFVDAPAPNLDANAAMREDDDDDGA